MRKLKNIILTIIIVIFSMTLYACNGGAYMYNFSNTNEKTKIEKVYIFYPFGSYRMTNSDSEAYSFESGKYRIEGQSIVFTPKKSDAYSGTIKEGKLTVKSQVYSKK
jgi:hypothetical protein